MLEFSYVALSLVVLILFIFGYRKWTDRVKNDESLDSSMMPKLLIPIFIWLIYMVGLSFSKILWDLSLPPRFPLLVFLPFFILTIIFYIKQKDNPVFSKLPLQWTSLYQSFRIIVETMLLYTFYRGIIPQEATFEGLNYDILIGISALFVGLVLVKNLSKYKPILVAWNILGIVMVLFVGFIIGTSVYVPEIWGATSPMTSTEFMSFPFLLIPGFLAPSAIFIHVVSLIQIRSQSI